MAKFQELLEKITDENLKKDLLSEFTSINHEKGENGRKLIEKDNEISKLRQKVDESSSYSEAFKLLKDKGIAAKDIPAMLEKMGKVKTAEDDLAILTEAYKSSQDELKDLRGFKKGTEVRAAVNKVLSEERANFKDDKGNVLKVIDRFIPEDKLYADIDISNEVLIRERVKQVLKDGLQAQEAIKKEFGFQGTQVPQSLVAQNNGVQNGNAVSQLKEVAQKEGPLAAMSEYLTLQKANK